MENKDLLETLRTLGYDKRKLSKLLQQHLQYLVLLQTKLNQF